MWRAGVVSVVLAALAVACGDGEDPAAQGDGPSGSAAAYCQAVEDLNERAEGIFSGVDEDDEEARERAEAELFQAAQEIALVEAAPAEIRADVRTYFEGVYGPEDETFDEATVQAAEQRVLAYEEEHCEQD